MELFFNNAGPCVPGDNYMIDPLQRIDHLMIQDLIERKRYFVLHAPRQTGKTSCLLALMDHLNAQGTYQALYCNIEPAQAARSDVDLGIDTVVELIAADAKFYLQDPRLRNWLDTERTKHRTTSLLRALLTYWCTESTKPVVLFLDEVDACLLYTSPSPRDGLLSRMPSSA